MIQFFLCIVILFAALDSFGVLFSLFQSVNAASGLGLLINLVLGGSAVGVLCWRKETKDVFLLITLVGIVGFSFIIAGSGVFDLSDLIKYVAAVVVIVCCFLPMYKNKFK